MQQGGSYLPAPGALLWIMMRCCVVVLAAGVAAVGAVPADPKAAAAAMIKKMVSAAVAQPPALAAVPAVDALSRTELKRKNALDCESSRHRLFADD